MHLTQMSVLVTIKIEENWRCAYAEKIVKNVCQKK